MRVDAMARRVGDGTTVDEALAAEVNTLTGTAEGDILTTALWFYNQPGVAHDSESASTLAE